MASSKLFSGGLPEITNDIIQYLRNDLKSLYSCVLVNRFLCRITIPLLWEDPFSVICRGYHYNFLDTYFSFFNDDDKAKLKEFGITINLSTFRNPLFHYPSFIKTLNTFRVELHTLNWINIDDLPGIDPELRATWTTHHHNYCISVEKTCFSPIHNENTSLGLKKKIMSESKKAINFICNSLFKLFINNNVSLNDLSIKSNFNIRY